MAGIIHALLLLLIILLSRWRAISSGGAGGDLDFGGAENGRLGHPQGAAFSQARHTFDCGGDFCPDRGV